MTRFASFVATLTILGCASGGGPATYTFAPTPEPLRYRITERTVVLVETPQGNQRSVDSTQALLSMAVGGSTTDGHAITLTFQSLDVVSSDLTGTRRMSGESLLGKPIRGTLTGSGDIMAEEAPPVAGPLRGRFDVRAWIRDKMPPLPPDPAAKSWPVTYSVTAHGEMTMTSEFQGTATFGPDTTWAGRPARIIVVQGQLALDGSGSPAGAPGEIAIRARGASERRYLWDPAQGVMLAATGESNLEGEVAVLAMGVSIPASITSGTEIRLVN